MTQKTTRCPRCGKRDAWSVGQPLKIDEEIDQVLFQQQAECGQCRHKWITKWWEVWTPFGIRIVEADSKGNAIPDENF